MSQIENIDGKIYGIAELATLIRTASDVVHKTGVPLCLKPGESTIKQILAYLEETKSLLTEQDLSGSEKPALDTFDKRQAHRLD